MTQADLFDLHNPATAEPHFDGATFEATQDAARLGRQLAGVYGCLQDGRWWTLAELAAAVGGSEAGVSARLRDLRKQRFGGHTVKGERQVGGLWVYRLEAP